jgi:hypothetical protein
MVSGLRPDQSVDPPAATDPDIGSCPSQQAKDGQHVFTCHHWTQAKSDHTGRQANPPGPAADPNRSARFTQSTSGIEGTPETYDSFGGSISSGDINGDGYRDLAISAPGEGLGGRGEAGGVHVLYGRASGLSSAGSQWFARNTAGVPGDGTGEYGAAGAAAAQAQLGLSPW